jgi:hypothetical protein
MDVYFVPIGRDRFESYFEAADEDPEATQPQGLLARWRARFATIIRDVERERHEARVEGAGFMTRVRRWVVRWIAERIAEQRLLWNLGGADEATLARSRQPRSGSGRTDDARSDAARCRSTPALARGSHLGLLLSVPFVISPGPNVLGYFFTFTVFGTTWRGAARAAGCPHQMDGRIESRSG